MAEQHENQKLIKHLKSVLSSIRTVNRLIIKEKKRERLIQGICDSLIEHRGYYNAWIVLFDEKYSILASAEAGIEQNLNIVLKSIEQGCLPHCLKNVMLNSKFLAILNPRKECGECYIAELYQGRGALSALLVHGERAFGVLTVSIPAVFTNNAEEKELFKDVADDIAFALHNIEVEKKREMMASALREARDQLETRVKQRTKQLEQLSAQLLNAQESERKRIAADLHDGIGQCISAVKFIVEGSLEQLEPKVPKGELKSLRALVPLLSETTEEIRNIIMNLRPSMLDDLGVLATIGWYCRQFKKLYPHIRTSENIDISETWIPDPLKITIFRILQEAMNNVAKHSDADRLSIDLTGDDDVIEMRIYDNGVGFNARDLEEEKMLEHFGIAGMKERTELSGGHFFIDSSPGDGTTIKAVWETTVFADSG